MPPLTWRNVDAPSFRDSIDSRRLALEALNKGFDAGKAGLQEYDNAQSTAANAGFIANLLTRYQGDPAQFEADAQSGAIFGGMDPHSLSAASLLALRDRPKDLQDFQKGVADLNLTDQNINLTRERVKGAQLGNQIQSTGFDWAKDDRTHQVADRGAVEAARAVQSEYQRLLGSGSPEEAKQAQAYISTPEAQRVMAALPFENQVATNKAGSDMVTNYFNHALDGEKLKDAPILRQGLIYDNQGKVITNNTNQFNLSTAKEQHAAEQAAMGAVQVALAAAPDADTARSLIVGNKSLQANPRAFNMAVQMLESRFPGLVGSVQLMNDPSAGGGGPAFAGGPAPSYDQTRHILESGSASGNSSAQASGSSAVGADQFTEGTFLNIVKNGKPAWAQGMNDAQILAQRSNPERSAWAERTLRSANQRLLQQADLPINNATLYSMHHFSPDVAIRFLKADGSTPTSQLFNQRMLEANPYLKGKTRDQVLANWAQRARDPSMMPAGLTGANASTAAQIEVGLRQGTNRNQQAGPAWVRNMTDTRDIKTVIDTARTTGPFKGVSEEYLTRKVRDVMDRTGGNAAQALDVLANSVTDRGSGTAGRLGRKLYNATLGHIYDPYNPDLPGGTRIDEGRVNDAVRQVRNGDVPNQAVEDARLSQVQQLVPQARAQYDQANNAYISAVQRARSDPRMNSILPRLEQARNEAKLNLDLLLGGVASEGQSRYQRPGNYDVGGIPGVQVRGTR